MNLLYRGIAGAGTSTTLAAVGRMCTPPIAARATASVFAEAPMQVGWGAHRPTLMHAYFSTVHVPRLADALRDPPRERWRDRLVAGWRALAAFLPALDGIVYVVDARRVDAAITDLEAVARDLADAGRDPAAVPLVAQLNHSDRPSARAADDVRGHLFWPGGLIAVVPSVATRAEGVRAALDALITAVDVN